MNAPASLHEPILVVRCDEPDGPIMREIRLGELSFERLKFLWEKLKDFDVLFNDFVQGDMIAFINHFVMEVNGVPVPTGLIWDIDDVGIVLVNEIRPLDSAKAHFVFWDKRFKGRENLCREMLKYGFEEYRFRRILVEVPLYARRTMSAVDRIGFTLEGRRRKAVKYKGDWFDLNEYSILPEDLVGKRTTNKTLAVCFSCGEIHRPNFRRKSHVGAKDENS